MSFRSADSHLWDFRLGFTDQIVGGELSPNLGDGGGQAAAA